MEAHMVISEKLQRKQQNYGFMNNRKQQFKGVIMSSKLDKMNISDLLALYKENKEKIRENCKEIEKLKELLKSTE